MSSVESGQSIQSLLYPQPSQQSNDNDNNNMNITFSQPLKAKKNPHHFTYSQINQQYQHIIENVKERQNNQNHPN